MINENDLEYIKAKILFALARKNKWLHAHTPFTNIIKWVRIKQDGKLLKKVVNELRKEGLILIKPTHYGEEVSLNVYQKGRILDIIKKYFPEEIK
jgi:hypothetical protein